VSAFKDHFSSGAGSYAAFRPRYPAALFEYLASLPPRRELAWDAATGNGQAAVGLADHFARVVATDASHAQIAHAESRPNVFYHVRRAEQSGLADACADLVTAAQALHWLDVPGFFGEARRVLRRGGAIAVWCYVDPVLEHESGNRVLQDYYAGTIGDYWPPERRITVNGYRSLEFPFAELEAPPFEMASRPTLAELVGYLRTWSATKNFVAARGFDPVVEVESRLAAVWGSPDTRRPLRYTTYIRVGRIE
jgi:SAM-dependent methyltransferase